MSYRGLRAFRIIVYAVILSPSICLARDPLEKILNRYSGTILWIHEAATAEMGDKALLSKFDVEENAHHDAQLRLLLKELRPYARAGDRRAADILRNCVSSKLVGTTFSLALEIATEAAIGNADAGWSQFLSDQVTNGRDYLKFDLDYKIKNRHVLALDSGDRQLLLMKKLIKMRSSPSPSPGDPRRAEKDHFRKKAGEELFRILNSLEADDYATFDFIAEPFKPVQKYDRNAAQFKLLYDEFSAKSLTLDEALPVLGHAFLGKPYDFRVDPSELNEDFINLHLKFLLLRTRRPDAALMDWILKNSKQVFPAGGDGDNTIFPFLVAALKSRALEDPQFKRSVDAVIQDFRAGRRASQELEEHTSALNQLLEQYPRLSELPYEERVRFLESVTLHRLEMESIQRSYALIEARDIRYSSLKKILIALSKRRNIQEFTPLEIAKIIDQFNLEYLDEVEPDLALKKGRSRAQAELRTLHEAQAAFFAIHRKMLDLYGLNWAERNELLSAFSKELSAWDQWVKKSVNQLLAENVELTLSAKHLKMIPGTVDLEILCFLKKNQYQRLKPARPDQN